MYNHNMKNTLPSFTPPPIFLAIALLLSCIRILVLDRKADRLPDSTVYRLTKTSGANAGELDVYCLNGADATIRPVDAFGHIVVSCGK